ncbi:MAG: amidohydrolase/deacetylase family metallohydrolase, partial [Cetobacterium sp.]
MKLLLKNCRLIDGELVDLFIENEIIIKVDEKFYLNMKNDIEVHDIGGSYVSKGWVDSHTHSSPLFLPYGDQPDKCGYPLGVTTVIDAGSTGAESIDEFYNISKNSKTRVKAFLNISKIGLSKMDELSDIENIDFNLIEEKLTLYPEFIVGLKVRMSKSIVK